MPSSPSWDASLYAKHTAHHRAFDDHILEQVRLSADFDVLDVGSGAGDLTAKLAGLVPDGSVVGVDASLPLVEGARRRFEHADNVTFSHLPAQRLAELTPIEFHRGRRSGPPFDLVISVATLHWVPRDDHRGVYHSIFQVLREGGQFRADFGGQGQIVEVRRVLNEIATELGGGADPWYFPGVGEVESGLRDTGFEVDHGFVRLVRQRRSVPDFEALVGWLDSQVLIAYQPSLPPDAYATFRQVALERFTAKGPREDGTFDQDYVRMDLLVTKPAN